jgi:predicted ATPase
LSTRRTHEPPGTPKHNLPAPRSSFVGRESEIEEVERELATTWLLTLTGVGGSGKTRLALEVARDLVEAYPDGAWLVALAPLSEEALVPKAMAEALGVPENPQEPLTDTLAEALGDRCLLLVQDNCEHLLEASARLVDNLLDSCPSLRVLATSREALGVEGEIRWVVPPLSVPDLQHTPSSVQLVSCESERLFVARARARVPSFSLSPHNTRAVAEICNRLGSKTQLAKQRTLRGALDWSHELLSEDEKKLFRRLSVFVGGWTLEASEAVGVGEGVEGDDTLMCSLSL